MMTKQDEIKALRDDPVVMAGIQHGLLDLHLGRVFSSKLVFGSLKGTGGLFHKRWYFRSIINLKKSWWIVKTPWQKLVTHRNCTTCSELNEVINAK